MALFRSFFGGGGTDQDDDNGAELIETFVERVETCSAPEDRKDALRALRSFAKKYRLAVGTMGMNAYMEILQNEQLNTEALTLVLDIIQTVLTSDDDENGENDELGERMAEVMLKKNGFIASVLTSIDQFDFGVRRTAIQLLTALLRHRGPEVQNCVLTHPMGVSKLVDIVHDNREIIRNEAILMLCELSRSNSQLQQLLAYDNLFILLMDVIETEPLDSIVIEDCLFVMLNLLRKNSMNQHLFMENNFLTRMGVILRSFLHGNEDQDEEDPETVEWSKQRTANIIFLLQIIRTLVSPDNNSQNIHSAQKSLYQTKILAELCRVLLSEIGASMEVLTESIIVVAEVIRGNYTNQEFFANVTLVDNADSAKSSLLVLLISMNSEKQPFKLRCAVFYCFLSYLYDNEFGKTKLIETLLPQNQTECVLSSGSLVCQAISSTEALQVWFGCTVLMHCLYQVEHLSDQLLRVQLSVIHDEPAQSLLSHVCQLLISMGNRRQQMRAGLLMLLGVWLNNSAQAVKEFMSNEDNLQYLTTHIVDECAEGTESEQQALKGLLAFVLLSCLKNIEEAEARKSLEALIERRIGKEVVISALEGLSRTEQFVRAAQKPQPTAKCANELFLDFYFVKFFKSYEGILLKQIKPNGEFNNMHNNENIVQSFKELIKRQDEEISVLKQEAKKNNTEMEKLKKELEMKNQDKEIEELKKKLEESVGIKNQNETLNLQLQEAYRTSQQWYAEAERYKQWSQQWQTYQLAQIPNAAEVGITQLQQQVAELEQQLGYGYQAFEQQSQTLCKYTSDINELTGKLNSVESKLADAEKRIEDNQKTSVQNGIKAEQEENNIEEQYARLKQDQDELLMLLADQHNKLSTYRKRLRKLGEEVSDDDDE